MVRLTKVILWNANGIQQRRHELGLLASDSGAAAILVSETHLRPHHRFSLPGYQEYRFDRPAHPDPLHQAGRNPGGGTAIFIRRDIVHRQLQINLASMEATSVAIQVGGTEITLTSVYSPPHANFPPNDLGSMLNPPGPVIIGGDLNAKHVTWQCRSNNTNGRKLRRFLDHHPDISVSTPDEPTHFPSRGAPDILDITLHKGLWFPLQLVTMHELSSDHLPVLVTFDATPTSRFPNVPPTIKTDWARFHQILVERLPPMEPASTTHQLDLQVASLQELVTGAISSSSKPIPKRDLRPPLPADIRDAINLRRQLLRDWHRARHPDTKRRLNRQNLIVKTLLDDYRTTTWTGYLESLDITDGSAWRLAKTLRSPKKTSHPLHGAGGLVYSAQDKAETFADTMEEQFTTHPGIHDEDHDGIVHGFMDNYFTEAPGVGNLDDADDEELQPVSAEEVAAAITALKPRKAPGLDKIGARALQSSPQLLLHNLVLIFNGIFRLRHFPQPWKKAKIILIQKPGKSPLFPQHYRPISLLPVLSKMFERLLLKRMSPVLDEVIRPEQFGFRRGHSTTLQLTRVVTHLVDRANLNTTTAAVLLDVSKAFDRVWHDGLLYKLAQTPLPPAAVHLLKSYLEERKFQTFVDGQLSTTRSIQAGVPQGSVLGPVLYLVYTNDMPTSQGVNLSLYADDALFYASSIRPDRAASLLQNQLDALSPWLLKWKICVNADKSEAILFKKPRKMPRAPPPPITLDGVPIAWKKMVKYLGVRLDWRLSFSPHVTAKVQEAKKISGFLAPLLCRTSPLTSRVKTMIFLMIIRSLVTYAAPAWWALSSATHRKKIEATQSKALRWFTRSPWFVRNDVIREGLQVPSIEEHIKLVARRMFEKAAESTHPHISSLSTRDGTPEIHRPRPISLLDEPP